MSNKVKPTQKDLLTTGITYVEHLQDARYNLVSDSQDMRAVLESIGHSDDEYGCLLVEVLDGDYGQVWGVATSVPYLNSIAILLNK